MIVCNSRFVLDLYCDTKFLTDAEGKTVDNIHRPHEFPHTYEGKTFAECAKQARQEGWLVIRDGRAVCPKCNRDKS